MQLLVLTPVSMASTEGSRPMEKRKLLITAYYSPLPNQDFYIRGSYAADIRLNGRGTNGADGTEVYVGMLAAPRTYPFGTRVKLPGLGVGEVHDRGGAILAHKNYDRIDVWMGYGEEGLSRALNWGARLLEGEVYFTPDHVEPGLSFSWVSSILPNSVVTRLKNRTSVTSQVAVSTALTPVPVKIVEEVALEVVVPEVKKEITRLEQKRNRLTAGLGKDSSGEAVIDLQRMLWELGYYDGQLSGSYDTATIDAVYDFQIDNGVLQSQWDTGSGFFGHKTKEVMIKAIGRKIAILSDYPQEAQSWTPAKRVLPKISALKLEEFAEERQELNFADVVMNKKVVHDLNVELDLKDRNDHVISLQNILIRCGYLEDGLNTGYYGQMTQQAVLKFQIEKGIVTSVDDSGAGRVGPQTLLHLNLI